MTEGLGVSFGRLRKPDRQASKQPGYLAPGIFRVQQSDERPSVGDDAQERQQTRPGQADARSSVELTVKPFAGCSMR